MPQIALTAQSVQRGRGRDVVSYGHASQNAATQGGANLLEKRPWIFENF